MNTYTPITLQDAIAANFLHLSNNDSTKYSGPLERILVFQTDLIKKQLENIFKNVENKT